MSQSVFDKIRESQEEEKRERDESLQRVNQDRVTKMLATRYAEEEAVQDRLKEMVDRKAKEDKGTVFGKIKRDGERWEALVKKEKEKLEEKSKIDE